MQVTKKTIDTLEKCYAVAPLRYEGKDYVLIAAEKRNDCRLYDFDGNKISTVWHEPGGTMSIVPLEQPDGACLATHRFYSPNDSAEASIILAVPQKKQCTDSTSQGTAAEDPFEWNIHTLLHLPFLHRFDILERNGIRYLIMCTIKSQHRHKDDWSSGGKVYAGVLPADIEAEQTGGHSFGIRIIHEGLVKNHGFTKDVHNGIETAVVCAENGVFRLTPPEQANGEWLVEPLLDTPASDAVFADLNGDGIKELLVISPFHGDFITIYEYAGGSYRKVYAYPEPANFAHAITAGTVYGTEYIFIGHREGTQRLLAFYYDRQKGAYAVTILDENAGAANARLFEKEEGSFLAVTNREKNEIAFYTFTQEDSASGESSEKRSMLWK